MAMTVRLTLTVSPLKYISSPKKMSWKIKKEVIHSFSNKFLEAMEDEGPLLTCSIGFHGQVCLERPDKEAVLSRFEFTYPPHFSPDKSKDEEKSLNGSREPLYDADGDLLLERKHCKRREGTVFIEHQKSTSLELVGEQVWRGALFLADYILHCSSQHGVSGDHEIAEGPAPKGISSAPETTCELDSSSLVEVRGKKVLEVASGVGMTSVVAGMAAETVVVTDVDKGNILNLIQTNMDNNKDLLKSSMHVKEIDFYNPASIDKIGELLNGVSLILAADVVYNNLLTDAFFDTIFTLMCRPPNKTLLVALEKRYVFTVADLDTVAPCYEYFLQCLERLQQRTTISSSDYSVTSIEWRTQQIEDGFPQYFAYERSSHLVLWKIDATLK